MTLVRAWASVPAPHTLAFVGDGPLRQPVEALVAELGLTGRVTLMGARRDVPDILARAGIFVLATLWEGLPLAVIEAMMSGVPVVASNVGGVAEAVQHGATGLLVPPGDAGALSDALRALLDDAERRREYGEAGRQRALAHFTEARMVADIDRIYTRVLDGLAPIAVRPA
jgi:glycosyltransferase involved in cell wall biosynthesis